MSNEYDAKLDGRDFRVEVRHLDEGGLLVVKVGTETFTLKASLKEDGTWTVNDTRSDHALKLLRRSGKRVVVEVDGQQKEVEWERVRKEETDRKTGPSSKTGKRVSGGVYPPMPGKVTEVRVAVGDKVEPGQTVCILEAMKMFNELKAPNSGTVKQINVKPGSPVALGDLLILIE